MISRNFKFFEDRFDQFGNKTEPNADQILPSSILPEVDEEVQVISENLLPEIPIEPESAEPLRAQDENVEGSIRRVTCEDAFIEQVRNLGPVRQNRAPNKYANEDCLLVDSLTSDINELN